MLQIDDIKQITSHLDKQVLSLYLHVSAGRPENQASQPAWEIERKNIIADIQNTLLNDDDSNNDYHVMWKAITTRLHAFWEQYTPTAKTLVLFVSPDDLISYELPVVVESQGHFGKPMITPLVWVVDEYERYLVVLVDKERARFITAYLGRANTLSELNIDIDDYDFGERTLMPASDANNTMLRQGNNRERFEDMLDEHRHRFYKEVADTLASTMDVIGADHIILAGAERSAYQLKELLHETVAQKVNGVLSIPMQASENEIAKSILEHARIVERENEKALVSNLIDQAKSGRRGALGKDNVLQAFEMQQVETLVLPFPHDDSMLVADLTYKALENNSEVALVHGEAAKILKEAGGIGAQLYYSLETEAS